MSIIKDKLFSNIDDINSTVVELRHHLHEHPELSNSEKETTKLLKTMLEEAGLKAVSYTHLTLPTICSV